MSGERIVDALQQIVGSSQVLLEQDQRVGYEIDWTRRFTGESVAVVRPGSPAELADVLRCCLSHGVAVVPQGGNTGLVGGAVPGSMGRPCIIVSTTRLNAIVDIDTSAGQVTVESGVTLAALEAALSTSGWEFGVDLGARDSATIGGMIATNAGGTRVLRYGSMRSNVLGVEAVLGTGDLVSHLGGLVKDNTGYDLAGLLCGSEGTLGIVTAARLRLVPRWPERIAVALACSDWADAVTLASTLRREVEGLDGLEAIDNECAAVAGAIGVPPPLRHGGVTLFAVWAGRGEAPNELVALASDREHVVGEPRRILESRDRQSEAIARTGIPHKFDVTLPLAGLAGFTDAVRNALPPHLSLYLFGHLGDGNLHVNVVGPAPDDRSVDDLVLGVVHDFGGSISAEHGIGRAKADYLHLSRSPAEISTMRALKSALDPQGLMNPGALFGAG